MTANLSTCAYPTLRSHCSITDLHSTRNESSLRAKVDEAMTIYNEHIQNMNHESEEETTVKSEDPKLSALSEDNEEVVERFSAALNAQIGKFSSHRLGFC